MTRPLPVRYFPSAFLHCYFLVLPASAANFTVTNDASSGPGSFRQALVEAAAVPAGTTARIEFEAAFFGEPRRVVLDQPLPVIRRSLVIDGPSLGPSGEPMVVLGGDANGTGVADGGDVSGLHVEVPVDGSLTVRRMGFAGFRTTAIPGGAVYFRPAGPAELWIEHCVFAGNEARWGGAVAMPGYGHKVSVRECLFVGNRAREAEGGALNLGMSAAVVEACVFRGNSAAGGGAIHSTHGSAEVRACFFENNEARGFGEGGAVSARQGVRIVGSTFAGNRARAGGALFFNQMLPPAPGAVIENSTFSGNVATAASGGALYAVSSRAVLRHCTITLNHSNIGAVTDPFASGGGIAMPGPANVNQFELHNCVVAENRAGGTGPADGADLMGPPASFSSVGGNVLGIGSHLASVFGQSGDVHGVPSQPVAALLGPLAPNGGPLPTHLPHPESPVVDAGVSGPAEGLAFDQRGMARPGGAAPDAGAVELVTLGYSEWAGFFIHGLDSPSPDPGGQPVLSPAQQPEADPDGDGVPNIREYLAGGDPLSPSWDALHRVRHDPASGLLGVRYLVAAHVVPGSVEVSFELSESLDYWIPLVPTPVPEWIGYFGGANEMEIVIPGITTPTHFVRLQARLVPASGD